MPAPALFLIDGTGPSDDGEYTRAMGGSFCSVLANRNRCRENYYRGPHTISNDLHVALQPTRPFAGVIPDRRIVVRVTSQVIETAQQVAARANRVPRSTPLVLVGYSRGGGGVIEAAKRIDRPIEYMFLFDAVDMDLEVHAEAIPVHVQHCLHIARIESQDVVARHVTRALTRARSHGGQASRSAGQAVDAAGDAAGSGGRAALGVAVPVALMTNPLTAGQGLSLARQMAPGVLAEGRNMIRSAGQAIGHGLNAVGNVISGANALVDAANIPDVLLEYYVGQHEQHRPYFNPCGEVHTGHQFRPHRMPGSHGALGGVPWPAAEIGGAPAEAAAIAAGDLNNARQIARFLQPRFRSIGLEFQWP